MTMASKIMTQIKTEGLDFAWEHSGGGCYVIVVRNPDGGDDVVLGPFNEYTQAVDRDDNGQPQIYISFEDSEPDECFVARTPEEALDDIALLLKRMSTDRGRPGEGLMRYKLEIEFESNETPDSDEFATMILSAFVQIEDPENMDDVHNVSMRLWSEDRF